MRDREDDTDKILEATGFVKALTAMLAALLVLASIALVANTIRLSIFARRREVEVMKLVGATNWFIRWPFVIEGVIVGAMGGILAVLLLTIAKETFVDPLSDRFALIAAPDTIDFPLLIVLLLLSCMAVSALGSGAHAAPLPAHLAPARSVASAPVRPLVQADPHDPRDRRRALRRALSWAETPSTCRTEIRDIFVEDERAVRTEIIEAIEDGFYKEVDEDALNQASYKGIVRELDDRFSHYLTPEEAELFNQSVSGRFEGVGMTVQEHPRGLLVATVFDGSPAEKAGIHTDDVITHVNGESIAGEPTDVSTAKIKGKPGTTVRLTVLPGGKREEAAHGRGRAREHRDPDRRGRARDRRAARSIGYIRLLSFTSGVHGELREEIDKLIDRGAQGDRPRHARERRRPPARGGPRLEHLHRGRH